MVSLAPDPAPQNTPSKNQPLKELPNSRPRRSHPCGVLNSSRPRAARPAHLLEVFDAQLLGLDELKQVGPLAPAASSKDSAPTFTTPQVGASQQLLLQSGQPHNNLHSVRSPAQQDLPPFLL